MIQSADPGPHSQEVAGLNSDQADSNSLSLVHPVLSAHTVPFYLPSHRAQGLPLLRALGSKT